MHEVELTDPRVSPRAPWNSSPGTAIQAKSTPSSGKLPHALPTPWLLPSSLYFDLPCRLRGPDFQLHVTAFVCYLLCWVWLLSPRGDSSMLSVTCLFRAV